MHLNKIPIIQVDFGHVIGKCNHYRENINYTHIILTIKQKNIEMFVL